MTDKVQKIRAFLVGIADTDGVSTILARAIEKEILPYIDSLQEESVSEDEIEKQFKVGDVVVYVSRQPGYSGFYILGNANDLSIGYSNYNEPFQIALRNCTIASEAEYSQFFRELNLNGYKWNNDTLMIEKIEPVSEKLEEAAKHYLYSNILYDDVYVGNPTDKDCIEMFKAGANWQKEQMMAKSIEAVVSQVPCSNEIILYNPSSVDKYYLPQEMNKLGLNKGDKVKLIIIKED